MKYIKYLFSFVLACFFVACSSDDDDQSMVVAYNLPANFEVNTTDEQVVIVKTASEFDALFGEEKDNLPPVNLADYDLVYLQGHCPSGIAKLTSRLDADVTPYVLHVDILQDYTAEYKRWSVAYLVRKSDKAAVKLNLNMSY